MTMEILPGYVFRDGRYTLPFEAILYFYKSAPPADPKSPRYVVVTLTAVDCGEDGTANDVVRLPYNDGIALEAAWLEWRAGRHAGVRS